MCHSFKDLSAILGDKPWCLVDVSNVNDGVEASVGLKVDDSEQYEKALSKELSEEADVVVDERLEKLDVLDRHDFRGSSFLGMLVLG